MLADEDADHYDDIKKGIAAIKSLIESEDTNSKNVRTKALRADLEVKGKTAPLQNGFCKTAPQRYETAQMQSLSGKDTMCVCVAVD